MRIYDSLQSRPVAPVLESWLKQEIVESDSGPNKYLSGIPTETVPDLDYPILISHFYLPFDDEGNFLSQKVKSHQNRIINWLRAYKDVPALRKYDFFTAKIGFNSLMTISGSFRKQCMLMSSNEEEYMSMRHEQGPAGVDIGQQVGLELDGNIPELDDLDPEVRIDYIVDRSLKSTEIGIQFHRFLHECFYGKIQPEGQPLAEAGSKPVTAMLEAQKMFIRLVVAQMAVAASFRDNDPARIPFLHPMNISDNPGAIYPLAA